MTGSSLFPVNARQSGPTTSITYVEYAKYLISDATIVTIRASIMMNKFSDNHKRVSAATDTYDSDIIENLRLSIGWSMFPWPIKYGGSLTNQSHNFQSADHLSDSQWPFQYHLQRKINFYNLFYHKPSYILQRYYYWSRGRRNHLKN